MSMTTDHNKRDLRVLVPVYLLTTEMITMMILCLIAIQCKNNYISMYIMNVVCAIYYIVHVFDMLLPTTRIFILSFYV